MNQFALISVHSLSYRCYKGSLIRALHDLLHASYDKQQHSCHVLHELPRHYSWSPAIFKLSLTLTVVNKAWQFVWCLWKCPPHPPASRAHALTRTQTHVFHRWIISVILLAALPNHWLGGWERARWITGVLTCYSSPADPGLVFPREAAQWRVCPSWHSAQRVNGSVKKPPDPQSPDVILFKVSSECHTQHRRVFLTSHVMCADTWGAAAQLTD